jgi:uncharacterized membrane protein YbhN (UPF0104 family)
MRDWRRWLAGAVLAVLGLAIASHRAEMAEALREIADLSPRWVAVLAALSFVGIITNGLGTRSVTPGLTLGRGVMVHQATTAANNTLVGSGPVSLGVRIAMLRSWQVGDRSIGLTVILLNILSAYKVWLIALAVASLGVSGAARNVVDRSVFVIVIAIAVVVLSASTAMWWTLMRHPRLSDRVAHWFQRMLCLLRRRFARFPDLNIPGLAAELRRDASALVRSNGRRIVTAATLEQIVIVITPLAVIRAFGIGPETVSTVQVLIAFGLIRLVTALTPIPGGIGITEVGTATLLIGFGGPETTVLAAVVTFRAITFVLPIFIGGACFALWRWRGRVSEEAASDSFAPVVVQRVMPDAAIIPASPTQLRNSDPGLCT